MFNIIIKDKVRSFFISGYFKSIYKLEKIVLAINGQINNQSQLGIGKFISCEEKVSLPPQEIVIPSGSYCNIVNGTEGKMAVFVDDCLKIVLDKNNPTWGLTAPENGAKVQVLVPFGTNTFSVAKSFVEGTVKSVLIGLTAK